MSTIRTAQAILKDAGDDWSNVTLTDLLGMVTGSAYEQPVTPPCTRSLEGISQAEQLDAMRELLRRPEGKNHLREILTFAADSPFTRHHCAEAIAKTWPEMDCNLVASMITGIALGDDGMWQLVCDILCKVQVVEAEIVIASLTKLLEVAQAHGTRTGAEQALQKLRAA